MTVKQEDSSVHCLYHKATEFRMERIEFRMNRMEKFILGILIYMAIFQLATVLNLPQKLMEHEQRARAEEHK